MAYSNAFQYGLLWVLLFVAFAQCQIKSPYLNVNYLPRECRVGVADCKIGINSTLSGAITVLLLENDSDTKVLTTSANVGFYIFTPSPDLSPGPGYKIRLKQGEAVSESVSDFTIVASSHNAEPSQPDSKNTTTTTTNTLLPTATTSPSTPASPNPKKPLGTGDKAAIAVGVVLAVVFLTSLIAFLILRQKKRKLAQMAQRSGPADTEKSAAAGAGAAFAAGGGSTSPVTADRFEIPSPISEVASPTLSQSSTLFQGVEEAGGKEVLQTGPVELSASVKVYELPTESNVRAELPAR